jgi:hypothetical protein
MTDAEPGTNRVQRNILASGVKGVEEHAVMKSEVRCAPKKTKSRYHSQP